MKEKITNIIQTFQSVSPILGNALKSTQLFNPQCELTEPDTDILCEYDVKIPMSEGFFVIANIYRSKKAAKLEEITIPMLVCASFSDHGLHTMGSFRAFEKATSELKLKPEDIVFVDIELYPSSTFFGAGESLQLIISSDEIIPSPPYKKSKDFNGGRHVLFFGEDYDSYLLVPKVPLKVSIGGTN